MFSQAAPAGTGTGEICRRPEGRDFSVLKLQTHSSLFRCSDSACLAWLGGCGEVLYLTRGRMFPLQVSDPMVSQDEEAESSPFVEFRSMCLRQQWGTTVMLRALTVGLYYSIALGTPFAMQICPLTSISSGKAKPRKPA